MKLFHIILFFTLSINTLWASETRKAIFAGGCFWCMEPPFDAYLNKGVLNVISGYSGGTKANPTYEEVSAGSTGHKEVVEVSYDPQKISYEKLLEIFWKNIDPLNANGQFCDNGDQYQSAIFYATTEEKAIAEKSLSAIKDRLKKKGQIVTQLLPAKPFFPAEKYHQDYYQKNPVRYKFYRYNCGRDKRLEELWSK
jgi:peptide-methionine (S)-S-oxide reductase